uniref:Uncharacterized protein n=1 Tax=Zea mays TaxID=4577 RepID=A0A804QTT5_MAIZE
MLRRWTSDTMGNGCNCKENRLTSHQWSATRSINTTQAAMGVPQRRQQVRRRPERWLLSFSMMKWYRFTQTGCPLQPTTKQTNQTHDSIADAVLLYVTVCKYMTIQSIILTGGCTLKATA